MELFLIYLVTRLTDLKDGLSGIATVSGILLGLTLALRMLSEFLTEANIKDAPLEEQTHNKDVALYQGIRRSTKRGLWMFAPVFVLALVINMFLPTTRDAVVIAGGYGLVEAVKNERVQTLFSKSAQVASKWLDEQLNDEPAESKGKDKKARPAEAAASQ